MRPTRSPSKPPHVPQHCIQACSVYASHAYVDIAVVPVELTHVRALWSVCKLPQTDKLVFAIHSMHSIGEMANRKESVSEHSVTCVKLFREIDRLSYRLNYMHTAGNRTDWSIRNL